MCRPESPLFVRWQSHAFTGNAEEVENLNKGRIEPGLAGDILQILPIHKRLTGPDQQAIALGFAKDIESRGFTIFLTHRVDDIYFPDASITLQFGAEEFVVDAVCTGLFAAFTDRDGDQRQLPFVGGGFGNFLFFDGVGTYAGEELGGFAGGSNTARHRLTDIGETHQ